jgi:uncharacterized repeat protein (TIGR03803 family)
MRIAKFSAPSTAALLTALFAFYLTTSAVAQQEKILYTFDGTHGRDPSAGLIFDSAGNLYGTTPYGGTTDYGTVFELTPVTGGKWRQRVLHNFEVNGTDGCEPRAGLIFDRAGNLYGTASECGKFGGGTVFELTPQANGAWSEQILHNFNDAGTDGAFPAGVVFDAAGNLYGTTSEGGVRSAGQGWGTVFQLVPGADGHWIENILYDFSKTGSAGHYPPGGVVLDAMGNLYGTTADDWGAVFELSPGAGGVWIESTIHSFPSSKGDGVNPLAGLIIDSAGNLYGTTVEGGPSAEGSVFELSLSVGGGWSERILYGFGGDGAWFPEAPVALDGAGNLYGTTVLGNNSSNTGGIVFELHPTESGLWKLQTLHSFLRNSTTDGWEPEAGVVVDGSGNVYGTTFNGGANGVGIVYEIVH